MVGKKITPGVWKKQNVICLDIREFFLWLRSPGLWGKYVVVYVYQPPWSVYPLSRHGPSRCRTRLSSARGHCPRSVVIHPSIYLLLSRPLFPELNAILSSLYCSTWLWQLLVSTLLLRNSRSFQFTDREAPAKKNTKKLPPKKHLRFYRSANWPLSPLCSVVLKLLTVPYTSHSAVATTGCCHCQI